MRTTESLIQAVPYARLLALQVERDTNGIECILPFREQIVGNARLPAVHGGVVGAFLELTALLGLMDEYDSTRVPKPINFSIDYLRSVGPKDTRARIQIVKLGRRIANVRVEAYQDDRGRLVAAGIGNFLL